MKREFIEIFCENNQSRKTYSPGTSLSEIADDMGVSFKYPALGAMVNNKLKELSYQIYKPKNIHFFDITSPGGMRMYVRSLSFVLIKAVKELFPSVSLKIEHSVSKGFYCELENHHFQIDNNKITAIKKRMEDIIDKNIPFIRNEIPTIEAVKIFEKNGFAKKAQLFKDRAQLYTSIYSLDNQVDYFYGHLVPSTGYLKTFDLVKYYDGMLLRIPKRSNPNEVEEIVIQNKMFDIFREYKDWGHILSVGSISGVNESASKEKGGELIKISEALHEKKVAQIADNIFSKKDKVKIILIAGPSSSGKTSFSKKLAIQLKVLGLKPVQLSLDNYFVNRVDTPKDEKGEYNFEALDALDVTMFNQNLVELLKGKEIKIPKFSFEKGERYYNGEKLKINEYNIILIEGIHALNPDLTPLINPENKFKIYVSALTSVCIDGHNRIPTTDNRLIRRIVRDYRYRGYSATETIKRWDSVRKGEEINIFPFQEEADIMFNSASLFELGVLKKYADPVLKEVRENTHEFAEAVRLLKFLSYFTPIPDDEIPPTSIVREFIGGSSFSYE